MSPVKFVSPYVISTVTIPVRKNNTITIFGVGTTAQGQKQRILIYVVNLAGEVLGTMTRFHSSGTGSLPLKQADGTQAYTHPAYNEETKVYVEFQSQPEDGGEQWASGPVDTTKFIKLPGTPGVNDVRADIIPGQVAGTDKVHATMTIVQMPVAAK